MNLLQASAKDFFNSRLRKVVFWMGLLAAFIQVTETAYPSLPQFIQTVALIGLWAAAIYISLYLIVAVTGHYLLNLSSFLAKEINEQLIFLLNLNNNTSTLKSQNPTRITEQGDVYIITADRYGIGYETLEVSCTIKEDGSAIIRRKVKVRAYDRVSEIDNFLLTPEKLPTNGEITNLNVKSLTNGYTVTSHIKVEQNRTSAILSFTPPLSEGECLEYEMIEELSKNFYAINFSNEEIEARENPFDYFGWNINRPTRNLSLKVHFPEKSKPNFYRTQVKYASTSGFPSDRLQYREQAHLKKPILDGPDGDRFILTLKIEYPMIGLIYVLYWQPIAKSTTSTHNPNIIMAGSAQNYQITIREILIEKFDEGELRTLAHDLIIDYDNLPDQGKANKARELISFLERRNQLPKLVEAGKRLRPDIRWPEQPN